MKSIYQKYLAILFFSIIIIILIVYNKKVISQDRIPQLLIIDSQRGEPYSTIRQTIISDLRSYGYNDGFTLIIKYYSLANRINAANLVWRLEKNNKYDAIFINGTIAAIGLKPFLINDNRQKVIFGAVTDPIEIGLITSFNSAPKYNITGISYPVRVHDRLRFLRQVMPKAKIIGLVYADMPQSISYLNWIKRALKKQEFSSLKIITRKIQLVKGDYGHIRMAHLARKYILEIDNKVDIFMSPNDQMGSQRPFAEIVYKNATKPLLGLGKKDVTQNWGATMSIYPDLNRAGKDLAKMLKDVFEGKDIKTIYPRWPKNGIAFDLKKAKQFKIKIPSYLLRAAGNNIVK